ncbi:MAG: hypothetical protein IKM15_05380 [Peptococcaceae bacterium]|nr:hypothetical protein [Peptococcaceae bacterium]
MRFFLLFIAAVISAAIGFFNYLFLSGQIAYVPYALVSMAVVITMTFVAFHFIYLYYAKRKENKRQSKAFSQKEKEWEKNKPTCPESTAQPTAPVQPMLTAESPQGEKVEAEIVL